MTKFFIPNPSKLGKVINVFTALLDVGSLRGGTPRAAFASNKDYIDVCYTDPPNRGVQVHMQTLTSFPASKARGVPPIARTWHFILVILMWLLSTTYAQSLTNQLNANNGADPWLTYYEGNYYLATTTWTSAWYMRKSETLAGLKTAEPVRIYLETDLSRCCNLWAPEFRLLDGPNGKRWYFYYSAGTADTLDNQHTHVLESASTDPMGPYTYKGRIYDIQNDGWAIDGSVLELNDQLYFLFSSWKDEKQSIFIAPMSSPWEISRHRVMISKPEYDWESSGSPVNEGPVALHHDGKTFIIYSASGCWTPDYKLGMLTYNGGDPLESTSWEKHSEPVFERSDEANVFAPGHNGFFKSPDGTEDWLVYHANDSVGGGCDGRRTTRVQKFIWNTDGTPNFGTPVATSEIIAAPSGDNGTDPLPEFPEVIVSRFKAFNLSDAYLLHTNFSLKVGFTSENSPDTQFTIRPGLADPEAISIESVNFPGYYVRHDNDAVVLSADDGSETFVAEATWWQRPGLAGDNAISFESFDKANHYLGKRFGITALMELTNSTTDLEREDATFLEER
jgi:GH43 family beta-xylosidase